MLLCGGGLGNAVLFSIARAFKALGARVLYFAGYKRGEDLFKQDDIERFTDQVIWCTDGGVEIRPRRPQDAHFRGNIVQAMLALREGGARGRGGPAPRSEPHHRHRQRPHDGGGPGGAPRRARSSMLNPRHLAHRQHQLADAVHDEGGLRAVPPEAARSVTGKEYVVFSCFNQDQELDRVDFGHLRARLRANSMQEKLSQRVARSRADEEAGLAARVRDDSDRERKGGDMTTSANAEAIEAWNTILFEKFTRFRPIVTTGLAKFGDAVLDRHPPKEGTRVLDVGCGFGDTTAAIARLVGPRGEAFGVDAAPRFIDVAAREAAEARVANARFAVADVQNDPLGGPFDQAFSRFGTMFFASPVAAFRNVRRALAPGAKLTMVVWRKKEESGFFHDVEQRVLAIVPHPEKKQDDITCGPGPFSLGSPDVASAQLVAAGFERVTFERIDTEMCLGQTVDEAIDCAMTIGPAGEILRLAKEEGERKRPEVVATLRELFTPLARPDGVWAKASAWIVSAVARS